MPTFLLVPRAEGRADPDWEASLHDGPCQVTASDERMARRYADGAFCRAVIERPPGGAPRLLASPWSQPRLVRAVPVARRASDAAAADAPMVEGLVQIPTGPDDSALLIAARVR
jgi:hypothetical protein